MKKNMEYILGFILLFILLIWGRFGLNDTMLYFRLLIGLSLGYTLTRSFFGFAGSVNRAYHTGSTKLMRTLMWMFLGSSVVTAGLLLTQDPTQYDLWVNPINLGLILGGLLFGFGMAFSMCCASGVLTDIITGLPRAVITLIFFGLGVFIGFPIQSSAPWVKDTLISTETFPTGVYLPDFFKWDGLNGYLGAILCTAILAIVVVWIAKIYENKRRTQGTYTGVESEIEQSKAVVESTACNFWSLETYKKVFVNPWSLGVGAVVIGSLFVILMCVTKAGWGASTPYGFWFGRLLIVLGASPENIASFASKSVDPFVAPFFSNGMNVQNVAIILGTAIALLLSGSFVKTFKEGLSIGVKEGLIYAFGGLVMGFGTRLSNGCNVGALYTPIANFSLSGWIFLIFLVIGGIAGSKVKQKLTCSKCK